MKYLVDKNQTILHSSAIRTELSSTRVSHYLAQGHARLLGYLANGVLENEHLGGTSAGLKSRNLNLTQNAKKGSGDDWIRTSDPQSELGSASHSNLYHREAIE